MFQLKSWFKLAVPLLMASVLIASLCLIMLPAAADACGNPADASSMHSRVSSMHSCSGRRG